MTGLSVAYLKMGSACISVSEVSGISSTFAILPLTEEYFTTKKKRKSATKNKFFWKVSQVTLSENKAVKVVENSAIPFLELDNLDDTASEADSGFENYLNNLQH